MEKCELSVILSNTLLTFTFLNLANGSVQMCLAASRNIAGEASQNLHLCFIVAIFILYVSLLMSLLYYCKKLAS